MSAPQSVHEDARRRVDLTLIPVVERVYAPDPEAMGRAILMLLAYRPPEPPPDQETATVARRADPTSQQEGGLGVSVPRNEETALRPEDGFGRITPSANEESSCA